MAHPQSQDQVRGQPSSLNRGHRGSFLRGEATEAWNCHLHPAHSYISTTCLKGAELNETAADWKFRFLMHNFRNYLKSAITSSVFVILQSVTIPPGSTHPMKQRSLAAFCVFCFWRNSPQWVRASSFTRFLDHTERRTTVGRTSLNEWSARRRHLYPTTNNTHNRQTSTSPEEFEPTKRASGRKTMSWTARPLGPLDFMYFFLMSVIGSSVDLMYGGYWM